MQRVREAIQALKPQEADLISDRTVEMLLADGRRVRITAAENLIKSSGYNALHEVAVDFQHGSNAVRGWGSIDLPWADGETVEDCLAKAILLLIK